MAGEVDDADPVATAATQVSDAGLANTQASDAGLANTQASEPGLANTQASQPGLAKTLASDAGRERTHDVKAIETAASGQLPVSRDPERDLPEVSDSRYSIGAEVGRGGLGRVLRARDEVLDRPVALKQLFATDDSSRRRFIREALITARLQHPAIIPVYDAGRRADRSPFYAMKLVAGRPLDEAIKSARTLAARLALVPTVLAVADAIAYAHSERIIHRDLKPANVLVGGFGETIVIDWGLAKDLSIDDRDALDAGPYRATASTHTVAGAVLGTPGYMAPEQASGQEVDERADVYALGAILYHVISGSIPHEGQTLDEVIERAIAAQVKPLATREPDAPPDLVAIVDKAMAKHPAARYPTARELAEDLRRFQTGQLVGAHRYTFAQRMARWIRRHRAVTAVGAIAVVTLATVGTWSVMRVMHERDRADHERDEAITNANSALLTQARVSPDPALTLASLRKLSVDGGGWAAARTIVADALSQPLPDVLLHGTSWAFVTPDGRRAIGLGTTTNLWVAELVAGAKPARVPARFENDGTDAEIVVCDDSRRALVRTDKHDDAADVITVDLVTAQGQTTKYDEDTWNRELERCRAAYRLTTRAERNRRPGMRWLDAKTGEDRLLAGMGILGAWLADDGRHIVAIDDQGAFQRHDVVTGDKEVIEGAFQIGDDDKSETRAAMSRDGTVVVGLVRGAITFCDLPGKFCAPIQGTALEGDHTVVVAPDGSWACGRSREREGWRIQRKMPMPGSATLPRGDLYTTSDGNWLLGHYEGALAAQDTVSGTTWFVRGHDKVTVVRPLPDGRVFTVGREGSVRVSKLGTPSTPLAVFGMQALELSPDTRWLIADVSAEKLVRREIATGKTDQLERAPGKEREWLAIGDRGDVARVTLRDGAVFRYGNAGPWRQIGVHDGGRLNELRVLDSGALLTLGRQSLAIWDGDKPRYVALPEQVNYHYGVVLELDTAQRRAHVSCGEHRCLVDLATGKLDVLAESNGGGVMAANGRVLVTGSKANEYLVWDLDTLRVRRRIPAIGELSGVLGIARDGRRVVVRDDEGIELVDLDSDARTQLRTPDARYLQAIVFSPRGDAMIDNKLNLWDVASAERRRILPDSQNTTVELLDDSVLAVSLRGIDLVPDTLPRDPRALRDYLESLPFELDDKGALVVR